ncbi:MAG TPA: vWA domain-containing protein, partial [Planctomycetota bacterium]|nr:vWA domain-containing protein [Planctomycetota bacterium]
FMTDGTPTAGKVLKRDDILAAVRGWNRTAKITIHSIAVGDACDVEFLKKLADENRGDFVKR